MQNIYRAEEFFDSAPSLANRILDASRGSMEKTLGRTDTQVMPKVCIETPSAENKSDIGVMDRVSVGSSKEAARGGT